MLEQFSLVGEFEGQDDTLAIMEIGKQPEDVRVPTVASIDPASARANDTPRISLATLTLGSVEFQSPA
jgi:hypothetical protein